MILDDEATQGAPSALDAARAAVPGFARAVASLGLGLDTDQRSAVRSLENPSGRGFYIWGPVGRGKSMLAEAYFAAIDDPRKRRFHFHTFFRELQARRFAERGLLSATLERMIGGARAVLFDEFHVHDVADAVCLTAALEAVVERDVLLIATSNYDPDRLLPDPQFHHRFAIGAGLIRRHFDVIPLGTGQDYRRAPLSSRRSGFATGTWRIAAAEASLPPREITVNGLSITAISVTDHAAAFSFDELCGRALGIREYLSLAEEFAAIELHSVPDLAHARRDELMRFALLVDAAHDADVPLRITANAAPERARRAAEPPADLERTLSRLALLTRG